MVKKGKSQKHSKNHSHSHTSHLHKVYKSKRKTKDHDQIHEDMKLKNAYKLLNQESDPDLPGSAQNYCLHCAYEPKSLSLIGQIPILD
jgi:bud site selection protein 20